MTKFGFTPLHMVILLHSHTSPRPYSEDDERHASSIAVRDFTKDLLQLGLIEPDVGEDRLCIYRSTPKGKALIDAWANTPLPEQVWVIPKETT